VTDEGRACFEQETEGGETVRPLPDYGETVAILADAAQPFLDTLPDDGPHAGTLSELNEVRKAFAEDIEQFQEAVTHAAAQWEQTPNTNAELNELTKQFAPLAESSHNLVKQTDLLYKLVGHLTETCEKEYDAKSNDAWNGRDITRARKDADEARRQAVEQLKLVRYFWRQAHWLTERFPKAEFCDVEGLVKLVSRAEIEANDWSLTLGRYVGVAPEEEDKDFDFEEALREIHVELEDLNAEAAALTVMIKKNFEELGV
jgi:type I restriction enzyme M protein